MSNMCGPLDGLQNAMLEYAITLAPHPAETPSNMDEAIRRLIRGDKRMLSRLISIVEQEGPQGAHVMAQVFPHCGNSYCIGVTGPPGAGKSTLVDSLVKLIRSRGLTAGVIAVDPTSAQTGGAFLGDRIRMQRHFMDPGVYIRSMATRDNPGGLPRMVQGAVQLLDAAGTDYVLVESVGVGQTELGILDVADSVVLVLMPESGDVIQTLKAGLMEVADFYVVNKADLQGADKMVAVIGALLHMESASDEWSPRVIPTRAHEGVGVDELYEGIQEHREGQMTDGVLEKRRNERRSREFTRALEVGLLQRLQASLSENEALSEALEQVASGRAEPYSSALKLLDDGISQIIDAPPPSGTG